MSKSDNMNIEPVDFSIWDDKGRKLGAQVQTWDGIADADNFFYDVEAGTHYFWAHIHTTRDGKRYGATHRSTAYRSAAERDAATARKVEAARLRYFRQYVENAA